MTEQASAKIQDRDQVSALAKGLAIIEMFDENRRTVTISEAAVLTGMTRAAARRYLLSLMQLGYVFHDGKNFSLTPRVMRLGHSYLALTPFAKFLQFYVEEIGRETGESSTAAILEGSDAVVVAHQDPVRFVSMMMTIGTRLPLYSTAIGRVFLAFGDRAWAEQYIEATPVVPRTAKAIASKEQMRTALEVVRSEGYAVIDEEMELGLRSVAVPIQTNGGQIKAAMTVAANAGKYSRRQLVKEFLPVLRRVQDVFEGM